MIRRNRRKIILIALILLITGLLVSYDINLDRVRLFAQRTQDKIENIINPGEKTIVKTSVLEEENTVINVVDKVSPAVVSVVYKSTGFDVFSGPYSTEQSIGTGFIVEPNGIIVTNSHVVADNSGEYEVITSNGTTYAVQEVHRDPSTDIAILEINARGLDFVELGDSDQLQVGQLAIAIGNALGQYSNTVTTGVVSGVARSITASSGFGSPTKTYQDVIQTDAALNPGNSGGPLLNSLGQVIGINVATTQGADNIGFAIPVNTLEPILTSFMEEGRIVRPFLGVTYSIITEDIAELRDFPVGAYITGVVDGTPAEEAGIQRGDIITAIDGEDIDSDNTLASIISNHQVGDVIEITIDRDGEAVNVVATLDEAPQNL